MKQLVALLISLLFLLVNIVAKAQVNTQDSLALVDLYNSTNGANWKLSTNWLTKEPVSSWYGVTVNDNKVVSLSFSDNYGNNLQGTLPESIGNLSYLVYLDLSENSISGNIPSSIGNLSNLIKLSLYSNNFTGTIPESFGNLSSLSELSMSECYALNGSIPSSLGNLRYLTSLDLSVLSLTGSIPESFKNLTFLKSLGLGNNLISGPIPDIFGGMSSLSYLDIGSTNISGSLPPSIYKATNLKSIDFTDCQLSGTISDSLGYLTKLMDFRLGGNRMSGSLPSSIGNLRKLTTLYLGGNNFSGSLPDSLFSSVGLVNLDLSYNQFSGRIPSNITNLPSLEILGLSKNLFTFSGMEEVANMKVKNKYYYPQGLVPLVRTGDTIKISVGGTPENNTYRWYKDGKFLLLNKKDSTCPINGVGKYSAIITNDVATDLTLYSDTITITSLPIKAIKLFAKENDGQTLLQWKVVDEINTATYQVQRSLDGKNFTTIATLYSAGNGNNSYSYKDEGAIITDVPNIYYRILSTDRDGENELSSIVITSVSARNMQLISVFPNPVKNRVTIKGRHIKELILTNSIGVQLAKIIVRDATNPSMEVGTQAKGVYFISAKTTDDKEITLKIIKE